MEEFANRIKGQSLSFLAGMLEGIANGIERSGSEEQLLRSADKIRCIAEEIFNRELDSQESYQGYGDNLIERISGSNIE